MLLMVGEVIKGGVEIGRHHHLALGPTQASLRASRFHENEADQWLVASSNHDIFAIQRFLDQTGQVRLSFANIHDFHINGLIQSPD